MNSLPRVKNILAFSRRLFLYFNDTGEVYYPSYSFVFPFFKKNKTEKPYFSVSFVWIASLFTPLLNNILELCLRRSRREKLGCGLLRFGVISSLFLSQKY